MNELEVAEKVLCAKDKWAARKARALPATWFVAGIGYGAIIVDILTGAAMPCWAILALVGAIVAMVIAVGFFSTAMFICDWKLAQLGWEESQLELALIEKKGV